MANSAQAKKRARQAEKSRLHNAGQRSAMRSAVKKVLRTIATSNKEAATADYKAAVSTLDKAVTKGLIHKNKASRLKSRLNAKVKSMA